MGGQPAVGVEEEFVLLDARTGVAVPAAPRVLGALGGEPGVVPEFLRFQVETMTGVCRSLAEIRADLARLRERLGDAADEAGCVAVATAVAPFGAVPLVTADARYERLAARFPALVERAGTCACHVHVGIPSRAAGIRALAGLRPWLGVLLALSANSPYVDGLDSGWASARYPLWSRWPTARPPAAWRDVAEYDAAIGEAIRSGAAPDVRGVYFYARLSPRYPTVEVRIADVCLDAGDAVVLAGLVRALVVTALGEDAPPRRTPDSVVLRSLRTAARYGLAGPGLDVTTGSPAPAEKLVEDLLAYVRPALRAAGDLDEVRRGCRELETLGGGAGRQRVLRAAAATPARFAARLAAATRGTDDGQNVEAAQ
ncbi:glutamate--cysteine ligase [Amycolatopsis sp. NPDC049159]|uniref:carboxylate-amine ligase n=1 Tax=Amycolatopsis sp. NPDC049159 TaxID=3157210 RepID=UPI0033D6D019